MRALNRSFCYFIRQIAADRMLVMVCAAPPLCGAFFRFGIPALEPLFVRWFGVGLESYNLLLDLLLSGITPYKLCVV